MYPLKIFLKDWETKKSFAGYEVKKKRLHYYKVNAIGKPVNRRVEYMHEMFLSVLNQFAIKPDLKELLLEKMEEVAYQMNEESLERVKSLQVRLKEVQTKLERLDERYVEENLNRDLYEKFQTRYKQELEEVQVELQKVGGKELSNLSRYMKMGLEIASSIGRAWVFGSFALRRRLQYLVFPDGIYFDAKTEGYRTERVNFIFALIRSCSVALEATKNKLSAAKGAQSHWVPRTGIEPVRPLRTTGF